MARPRRRHGRGGAPFTGEPNGLQPGDDAGNRRSFKQTQLPPENIGNRKDPEEEAWVPNDDLGNRIDAAPTHEISGVLSDMNGRRGRRKKGGQPHQRVGRYIVGGVNPVVAGNVQRTVEAMKEADERKQQERDLQRASGGGGQGAPFQSREGGPVEAGSVNGVDEEGRRGRRRRRRRRDGREQVDGQAAQEVSERRAQRFFDFEEDDRFEYVLKSDPAQKQKDAHEAVANVLSGAGRDARVLSRVLDDESRPKVIVTIDEKGAKGSLDAERRQQGSDDPLFVLGNAALMSLNYLVNKIVNRYPDDRIRLAILPAADEKLYLESLEEHRRGKRAAAAPATNGAAGKAEPVPSATAPVAMSADAASDAPEVVDPPPQAPAALAAGEPEQADAEPSEKPKRRAAAAKVKSPRSKKAAAEEDEGTGANGEASAAEPEADAALEDSAGRKATKKKSSAKVSTRSRAASEPEATSGTKKATKATAKKATAKKATAKKATAKKTSPLKTSPSEG